MITGIIFFDFNGVLNKTNHQSNSYHPLDIVRNDYDPEKVLRLFKFALETNSMLVSISTYNHETSPLPILHQEMVENYRHHFSESELKTLDDLFLQSEFYCFSYAKDEMIKEFIFSYPEINSVKTIVAFEDAEVLIQEFGEWTIHQIWVSSTFGLTDKNIEEARAYF